MSKQIGDLAKNLASGMPRRQALWNLVKGIGAVAFGLMAGKSALAGDDECVDFCMQFYSGSDFGHCMAASAYCPDGMCAMLGNGTPICIPVE